MNSNGSSHLLLAPITVGSLPLPNRIVMAPMTRLRADGDSAPTDIVAQYYAQRASVGLIVSESTSVAVYGDGFPNVPGIYTDRQTAAWTTVVAAVHAVGGRMFSQLMHVGKPRFEDPVGPARQPGWAVVEPLHPSDLSADDIAGVITGYGAGALRAKHAGFDGVEFYNCNGFIMDRFLRVTSNRRTDSYGGSVANRVRLTLEALDAVLEVWKADRVGIRISPSTTIGGERDPEAFETFAYLLDELSRRRLAYIHMTRVTQQDWSRGTGGDVDLIALRAHFSGKIIMAGDFTLETAEAAISEGTTDAVAFARLVLANPDLPARYARGGILNIPDPATFYTPGPTGYVDYPSLG